MKTLKVLLQEVVSGIKAWVNSNFAQESNTVHKTGNETVNGVKTFTGATYKNSLTAYEDSGVSGYDYTPGSFKSVDTFIHRGVDHVYWGGLKHNWLYNGTSQTRFAVSNYKYANNTWNQGFWAVDLSASKDFYTVELVPSVTNGINLGSSSYQWNNFYANNYYYKGTAWGLDKYNIWSVSQAYSDSGVRFLSSSYVTGTPSSDIYFNGLAWGGIVNNAFTSSGIIPFAIRSSGYTDISLRVFSQTNNILRGIIVDTNNDASISSLRPIAKDASDLGTSLYRWKTINGINPGLLSIPNMGVDKADIVDISSWCIQDPDFPDDPTETIIDDSVEHDVYSDVPGWIHISFPNVAGNYANARQYAKGGNMNDSRIADGLASNIFTHITLVFPIIDALKVRIKAKSAVVRIFPCRGSV